MTDFPYPHNTLFYGDNLPILREHFPDECVDLIYLDPPFNSNRSYNVLFKDESGLEAEAQMTAFDDTWHWNHTTAETYQHMIQNAPERVAVMIGAMREFIGENQMMAYLVMMAARLVELQRVLKPTGSLYLHCDPTASHYLKIILDTIFGANNFRNEIIWKRSTSGSSKAVAKRFGSDHDIIFYYIKSDKALFNKVYLPYPEHEIQKRFRRQDEKGRYKDAELATYSEETLARLKQENRLIVNPGGKYRYKIYLSEILGVLADDIWDDIPPINSQAAERLGYPTQKPLALLERILLASSKPGDLVLDPFCGCGTAIAAAQKLGRRWAGIDITHLSVSLIKYRMKGMFPTATFDLVGEPQDVASAHQLAHEDRYQFQWWALSLIRARPLGETTSAPGKPQGKKGSDRGIDGVIMFIDDSSKKPARVLVQVKSGHVGSAIVRDLRGTVERENAAIGVLITLDEPTADMKKEAASSGFYTSKIFERNYPRIQILSIADLLSGAEIKMPHTEKGTFKASEKPDIDDSNQPTLGI